ncbi:WD-40 repeat protein [Reticulomyxa filosa]|uniref:WD-40 repeat protein n=1 Tax=Reticulomyxa filosa TaxID=46433 RepID=X6P0N6_RETFI|nr:WD-40 repeat protein [Reticulomyxa filosa]|eukprot:ETO31639.1 WD-40 repeat protein [Reticulomyxa filosa]
MFEKCELFPKYIYIVFCLFKIKGSISINAKRKACQNQFDIVTKLYYCIFLLCYSDGKYLKKIGRRKNEKEKKKQKVLCWMKCRFSSLKLIATENKTPQFLSKDGQENNINRICVRNEDHCVGTATSSKQKCSVLNRHLDSSIFWLSNNCLQSKMDLNSLREFQAMEALWKNKIAIIIFLRSRSYLEAWDANPRKLSRSHSHMFRINLHKKSPVQMLVRFWLRRCMLVCPDQAKEFITIIAKYVGFLICFIMSKFLYSLKKKKKANKKCNTKGKIFWGSESVEYLTIFDLTLAKQLELQNPLGVQLSPDGGISASWGWSGPIRLVDVKSNTELGSFLEKVYNIRSANFSPDGRILLVCVGDVISIWDATSQSLVHDIKVEKTDFEEAQVSSDGCTFVIWTRSEEIKVWDAKSQQVVQSLIGHSRWVMGTSFSWDCKRLLSWSLDQTIRIWDVATGNQLQVFEGHVDYVTQAQFSPDEQFVVSSSADKTIRIWDVKSGRQVQKLEGHSAGVDGVQFSVDGDALVSWSSDNTVRVWESL